MLTKTQIKREKPKIKYMVFKVRLGIFNDKGTIFINAVAFGGAKLLVIGDKHINSL